MKMRFFQKIQFRQQQQQQCYINSPALNNMFYSSNNKLLSKKQSIKPLLQKLVRPGNNKLSQLITKFQHNASTKMK